MEGPDASWVPQSPDLSGCHSNDLGPIHPQHQGYRGSISNSSPYSPPTSSPHNRSQSQYMPRSVKKEERDNDGDYLPDASLSAVPDAKPPRARKAKPEGNGTASGNAGALLSTEHIEVKTKFPVARIKRIMQADDDVGKVAQVTPVVVSKALELFMISLVTKAATEAKSRSSKRVSAVHLKQAVTKDEQFDFLSEIVSKVAEAPAAAEKSEDNAMEVEGKKRKGGGRKKRKADDDDF